MSKVLELFCHSTSQSQNWNAILDAQQCPLLARKCLKNRKSEPDIAIGTCTVQYGKSSTPVMICPIRMLERKQIFTDCLHLLTLHEPGNELHVVGEIDVPGGSVDYCLVSVRRGKPVDFVGIELQTLDTTGTVWPERQRFLKSVGVKVRQADVKSKRPFGMNWKMTAKTTLVQLHHKIETFEAVAKHLVLVLQDCLMSYMKREFSFGHLENARPGDPMHFHAYSLVSEDGEWRLKLAERFSTDTQGIGTCLGLQATANVQVEELLAKIEERISQHTLLTLEAAPLPVPKLFPQVDE